MGIGNAPTSRRTIQIVLPSALAGGTSADWGRNLLTLLKPREAGIDARRSTTSFSGRSSSAPTRCSWLAREHSAAGNRIVVVRHGWQSYPLATRCHWHCRVMYRTNRDLLHGTS